MKQNPSFATSKDRKSVDLTLQVFITKDVITEKQLEAYEEVAMIRVEHKKHHGHSSTRPAVIAYDELYAEVEQKNDEKNALLAKLRKAYEE